MALRRAEGWECRYPVFRLAGCAEGRSLAGVSSSGDRLPAQLGILIVGSGSSSVADPEPLTRSEQPSHNLRPEPPASPWWTVSTGLARWAWQPRGSRTNMRTAGRRASGSSTSAIRGAARPSIRTGWCRCCALSAARRYSTWPAAPGESRGEVLLGRFPACRTSGVFVVNVQVERVTVAAVPCYLIRNRKASIGSSRCLSTADVMRVEILRSVTQLHLCVIQQ